MNKHDIGFQLQSLRSSRQAFFQMLKVQSALYIYINPTLENANIYKGNKYEGQVVQSVHKCKSIRTLALYTRPHGLLAGPGMKRTLTATLATAL
jgi:hypothetical protein